AVFDVNCRLGLFLNLANHLAAGPDDVANLVRIDGNAANPGRKRRQLRARVTDHFDHLAHDEHSGFAGLGERVPHDLRSDAAHLNVHLESGDTRLAAGDLEVHIPERVFDALDIGQDSILPTFVRGGD